MDDAADESDSQWRACMNACGLSVDTQDAIMDPRFTYLRLSTSCLSWVNGTVEMRYEGLHEIQKTSRFREMEQRQYMPEQQQQGAPGISLDIWDSGHPIDPWLAENPL